MPVNAPLWSPTLVVVRCDCPLWRIILNSPNTVENHPKKALNTKIYTTKLKTYLRTSWRPVNALLSRQGSSTCVATVHCGELCQNHQLQKQD